MRIGEHPDSCYAQAMLEDSPSGHATPDILDEIIDVDWPLSSSVKLELTITRLTIQRLEIGQSPKTPDTLTIQFDGQPKTVNWNHDTRRYEITEA